MERCVSDKPKQYTDSTDKTAIVKFTSSGARRVVHLKERWCDVPVKAGKPIGFTLNRSSNEFSGDIINIVSPSLSELPPDPCPAICITFKDPATYLIHHPDLMLTMTSIANAMPCPRRPLLQALIKPAAPVSKSMLYGTILHELLQAALSEQSFGGQETRRRLKESLTKESRRLEVWGSGLGEEDVNIEVGVKAVEGFETFERKWVGPSPTSEGDLHSTPGDKPSQLAIVGLHDIEEDIWSPKWGLKGKVDASVQAQIVRDPTRKLGEVEEHVAPLEIKTGRSVGVMAHRAQTMLYTLLMEDRYGVPIPAGLLYYSQLDSILRVEARPNELRALIIARNELAAFLSVKRSVPKSPTETAAPENIEEAFLPPTIDNPKECRKCYSVDSCMLYRKTEEASGPMENDNILELFEEKTGHLSKEHAEFYKKWDTLLTVEEQDMSRFRSQLWTMTAKEREKNGRCFGDMIISDYSNDVGKSLAKIHRHTYTFMRAPRRGTQAANTSLLSGHIAKGDPVSLSIEPDLLCLSRGFVTDLTPSTIVIGVTYKIDVEALLARTKHRNHAMSDNGDQVVFRIDKDEMTSGIMRMRNNLAQLFFTNGDEQRRRLVVDLEAPQFEDARALRREEVPASLNEDQKSAMEKVMTARDYALILGMPGTGKTTTIAEIIKALVKRGKSVLLTSYTHSAVDTILMKLVNAEFPILRLGNIDKVNPEIQHMTLEALGDSSSMQQLESRLLGPPVVAATCLSIEQGGLDVSLFRMLSEAHPEAVAQLRWQYRMNEDIMCLSNELVYEGRLQCGSEEVAHQGLILPIRSGCGEVKCESTCWVQDLLEEKVKAVFVDTDDVPGYDSKVGDLVQNATEAKLIYQLSSALVSCGIKQQDMAVITPYRQQIKVLSGLLRSMPNLEILTADKSQGRDKDVILISLVRSNESGNIGDLLKDWRRINVSFTRAKKKLVIFGSARTLRSDPLLCKFLKLMQGKGWVYKLPKGADQLHSALRTENVLLLDDPKKVDGEIKVGKLGRKILDGKAFVRDVIAVSSTRTNKANTNVLFLFFWLRIYLDALL
ncbi:putative DNA replication helicase dna2 [Naematelia encephala]|uniref:DNA replication ATP-dependent helicase/nuclease DNA2 n=1 Tax=Naematelia encephala TaxID=71784 RepID=A0A1Y2BLH9_9TREE|nr:putative DNA replication helicase dna2 [Naematelia encephala]